MMTFLWISLLLAVASVHGQHDYGQVIEKSLLFYEAQRSGFLPDSNRIDWRGDSALDDAVLGGYYDAGDHVKFGFPMASSATQLAWGAITFQSGFEAAGQIDYIKECLKWFTDYFIACHESKFELVGQIGDGYADHGYWGRPEDMTMNRPAFKITSSGPGSDLAGETAAALAAASIFYRNIGENSLADDALQHARDLFEFADTYRGVYTETIPAGDFYNSWSGFNDELTWAAAWLAKATGEDTYLNKAKSFYDQYGMSNTPTEFSWDNKVAGVQVLMFDLTGDSKYQSDASNFLSFLRGLPLVSGSDMVYVSQWGSNRHAGNVAHLAAQAAAVGIESSFGYDFAKKQVDAILGANKQQRSYVVGYGQNPPQRPHHRSSSCPDMPAPCDWNAFNSPDPNPQVLNGAVVGGPDQNGDYTDSRNDYILAIKLTLCV